MDEEDGDGVAAQAGNAKVAARGVVGGVDDVALGGLAAGAQLDECIGLVSQSGSELPLEDGFVVDADVGEEARFLKLKEDPFLGVGGGGPVGAQVGLQHVPRLL